MKKIYSTIMMLAMMVTALSFTACGGDDDEDTPEVSICGTWKCVSANYGEWDNDDGTQVGDIFYINEDHTYEFVGNNDESGTWSLNGNKFTCTSYGVSLTATINKLTASTLSYTVDGFGISYSFSRQ